MSSPASARTFRPNYPMVVYVFLIFAVISLLTNSLGPLIPEVISSFHLSLTTAGLMPFAFFAAYGAMSIPAGLFVAAYGEKWAMVLSFALAAVGCATFGFWHVYWAALPSLFVIGAAMAVLQVAVWPLLREAGGEKNYAFNSTAAQLVFGAASFLSPELYSWLVTSPTHRSGWWTAIVLPSLPWISLYWVFAVIALAMVPLTLVLRFPEKEAEKAAGLAESWKMFRNPTVVLYFISIFAYVACEQGTSNWISEFLRVYHGADPRIVGAHAVAGFWGLMTLGCLLGLPLLKYFDSRRVLIGASVLALCALTAGLFGPKEWALWAFPCVGLFASVMWPVVFSLGMNSIATAHGVVSGILCTAIIGGAVMPPIIGRLGDHFGLRGGMLLLYITFGWILSVGFWARPLVSNTAAAEPSQPSPANV